MPSIYAFLKDNKKHKAIIIDRVNDFFDLALRLMKDKNNIYRGVSTNDQKYPKIIRSKDCSMHEHKLLLEFERYYGLYSYCHNFWEFVSLAQHHGLKTRLIDFTNNIFVATFFSLYRKANDGNYKVYVFGRDSFASFKKWNKNTRYVSEPDDSMADNVITAFKIFGMNGTDFILDPNYPDNRMFAQQGLFVVPGVISKEHVDKMYEKALIEINISPRIRKYILNRLNGFGFDEYRLMPDLDSVSNEINDNFKN